MTFPLFARKNITSTEALANSSNLTSPETAATESTSTGVVIPTELEEGDSSKTTLQDDEHLHFNQSEYNVTATTKQIGLLYQFTVVTPHSDQVVFGIDTNDVQVNETFRMGPATGLLYADQGLTAGHYHFNVTAEIFSTQEHAESKVNVIVTDKLSATMGVLRVCNSSQVYNLREENFKGVTLQPPCTLDSSLKCSLSMVDQTPGGDFFRFDKDNGTLRAVRRIDREDAMFASSATPASITVTLDVTCLPLAAEPTHLCIPHHALYSSVHSSQRITMKIEIEDVNDNWPLFTVDRLVVGYPFRDVAKEILPPSIVNVKAHDKDVGENALIRYSIMPSEHSAQVTIHARTGSVYPTVAFRYTDFVFTVLAQDRDGQKGCNNATLHVQVIMLYRHEISVVYVENSVTEDAAEVMHQLRNASDYTFYVLDAGVVSDVTAAQADVTGSDTVLRAVVYALDTDNNVVSHIDMHAALSRTALIKTVTALPSVSARKELVIMATAVIILSVIVAALLVFFAITVYVVYIRPRRFGVFITPTSELDPSTQKLLENMDQGYLATGISFSALHHQFLIGTATISIIVKDVCNVICKRLSGKELPEPTCEQWLKISKEFFHLSNFPNCIGAIDGKHIRIKTPYNSGSLYYNYKHYSSIVLLALADANYCFTSIDVGAYGREGDCHIFNRSILGQRLRNNQLKLPEDKPLLNTNNPVPFVIVGDEAFGLGEHLMRPYPRRNLTDSRKVFNYRLTRARRFVECAFGILLNKWAILHTAMSVQPKFAEVITKTVCVLHNFVRRRDGYNFSDTLSCDLESVTVCNLGHTMKSLEIRKHFEEYFTSPQGAIEWQYRVI